MSGEAYLRAVTIGEPRVLTGRIQIVDYDPAWPELFSEQAPRIRSALGERVLQLEHVGSTSVPSLPAKPIIDILLVVRDSADESAYVSDLERAGYALHIREPDWYEHRCLKGTDPSVNLHVFSIGCIEIERMIGFRDWLRSHPEDRELYANTKRQLAQRDWKYTQDYADAKTDVVEEIMARSRNSS